MLERLTKLLMLLAGVGLLLMMLLIVVDVGAKYVFNSPIPGVLEMVAFYFMTMVVFLPLAFVQQQKQHLMVDLFTRMLPGRVNHFLDLLASIVSLLYLSLLALGGFQQALYMTAINQTAEILDFEMIIWPTLWVLPVSIVVMMFWLILHAYRFFRSAIDISDDATNEGLL